MNFRTDLAVELKENYTSKINGVYQWENCVNKTTINRIKITNSDGAKKLNKPIGNYITISMPPFTDNENNSQANQQIISDEIEKLIANCEFNNPSFLVVGIGNRDITPDALGPLVCEKILATRHLGEELKRSTGLTALQRVAVIESSVMGKTGIEGYEIVKSVVDRIKPTIVITVDALACASLARLGCTVQICDSGISPGSGINNSRKELTKDSLGVDVISIGVPTIVDGATLASQLLSPKNEEDAEKLRAMMSPRGEKMLVTPSEIDLMISRAVNLISWSINCALHPDIDPTDLKLLINS